MKKLLNRSATTFIYLGFLSLIISCSTQKNKQNRKSIINEIALIKLHGSSTLGTKLIPSLAMEYLRSIGMDSIQVREGTNALEKRVYGYKNRTPHYIEIFTYGSSTGFKDLESGACDIAMSSKPIDKQQIINLKEIGPMNMPQCQHTIGFDGITLIVNNMNPLVHIDLNTIRLIFKGDISTWSEISKNYTGTIHVYTRDDNSGTSEVFKTLVMGNDSIKHDRIVCIDNVDVSRQVAQDPIGIGYTSITLSKDSKMLPIKVSKHSTAIPASEFNILTDEYPLSRALYLYTAPIDSIMGITSDFISFINSNKGQKIVEENNFIAQIPKLSKTVLNTRFPKTYKKTVDGAMRVSIPFHFAFNQYITNAYMVQNVNRLIEFITKEQFIHYQLLVLGFSDSIGDSAANLQVSYQRAKVINSMLHTKIPSLQTTIHGFGADVPVAPNDTPLNRQKNRRVEVWIRPPSPAENNI